MAEIILGGELGKIFGKSHHRLINKTLEAPRALAATLKGFQQFMISSERRGITYAVFKGKKNIGKDDLEYPTNDLYPGGGRFSFSLSSWCSNGVRRDSSNAFATSDRPCQ